MIPLEDNFNDILGKAARGQKIAPSDLAAKTGVPQEKVAAVLDGEVDHVAIRKLAPALNLDAESLVAMADKSYLPKAVELDGLAQFTFALRFPFLAIARHAYQTRLPRVGLLPNLADELLDFLATSRKGFV